VRRLIIKEVFAIFSTPIKILISSHSKEMEKIWHHSFYNVLSCVPDIAVVDVLITEPPFMTKMTVIKWTLDVLDL
jgi:hypothetical protein